MAAYDVILLEVTAVGETVALVGDAGPKGDPGPVGATGATGPRGVNPNGAWNSTASYATGDIVTHNGSTYLALATNTNIEPGVDPLSATDWQSFADAGATGATGASGATGPDGATGPVGQT